MSDADYMMRRSLQVLLSDLRGRARGSDILDVVASTLPAELPLSPLRFPLLCKLINSYAQMRALRRDVLPSLTECTTFQRLDERVATQGGNVGQVLWHETWREWRAGQSGTVVVCRLRQVTSLAQTLYASELLREAEAVCHDVLRAVRASVLGAAPPTLADMMGEIEATAAAIKAWQQEHGFKPRRKRGVLSVDALEESISSEVICDGVRALRSWYLQVREGEPAVLDTRVGMTTYSRGMSMPHLYELWCFVEFARAASVCGYAGVQTSFLRTKRRGPEFRLGDNHYAFYDHEAGKLVTTSASPAAEVVVNAGLPRAKAEWFIQRIDDFPTSIVVDAKYARWQSVQALKVMGYMMNYGVRHGALILRRPFRGRSLRGSTITDGLFRVPCPQSATLWVMNLTPSTDAEARNADILAAFTKEVFGRPAAMGQEVDTLQTGASVQGS